MRLSLTHARAMTIELARYPAYVVPTLVFPSVFFLFFAASETRGDSTARTATFAGLLDMRERGRPDALPRR